MKNKIVIYRNKNLKFDIKVKFDGNNIWLTQNEIAKIFGVNRPAITKHLDNVFTSGELSKETVCSKMELTAKDGKKYNTNIYNLDAIISVGYRVNSVLATGFRIWATKILRNYLVSGYAINKKRLLEQNQKLESLKNSIDLITSKSKSPQLKGEMESMLELISDYTNSIYLLTKYDERGLTTEGLSQKISFKLTFEDAKSFIESIKVNYGGKLTAFFGQNIGDKLKSVIGVIDQTYDNKYLYRSIEEKAANLLYLVIKDHPFIDGNKRIGSLLFVYYLSKNNILLNFDGQKKINDRALVALALLIATSEPGEKETLIKLVINLIK